MASYGVVKAYQNNIENLSETEYMKLKKVFNGIVRLYVYIKRPL